jgi:hypothetical protein
MRISTLELIENEDGQDLTEYWHPPPCSLNRAASVEGIWSALKMRLTVANTSVS